MEFNQADINSIIKAKENENLVVFVGAGVSKFSEIGTIKFPDWMELVEGLKRDTGIDSRENDFLKIAQLYHLRFGEYRLYEKLKELIPLHASPSKVHEKIFDLNPKYIITTNWDNLLEKTIENNGLIYDIVKNDADLVKSFLPRKLVKIHGDLERHNIVFKEDDYLNFSLNSPLIENFLKHILSTSTVIFLGYSYSDYNLKIISKWIEKQSSISPPRFLLSLKYDEIQSLYLNNHNIKVLHPSQNDLENNYSILFNTFLDNIIQQDHFPKLIQNISEKNTNHFTEENRKQVVDYIYQKVKGLAELKVLLPEQITGVLSNCTVGYHSNCFGLWFHDDIITTDYEKSVRSIYNVFFEILYEIKNKKNFELYGELYKKIELIIEIFFSANCIFLKNKLENEGEWLDIRDILTIDLMESKSYKLASEQYDGFMRFSEENVELYYLGYYNLRNNDDIYNLQYYKKIQDQINHNINNDLKNKNYNNAIISMFNMDVIIDRIQHDYSIQHEKKIEVFGKKTNWQSKIQYYPVDFQKHITPLEDLLTFKTIYKFYYEANNDSKIMMKQAISIKNGGFGFNINEQRSNDRCIQILRFCASNNLMIDHYTEFHNLMTSYVTMNLEIQFLNKEIILIEHELFILIKYYKYKELKEFVYLNIFKPFSSRDDFNYNIVVDESIKIYLLETFKNLTELYRRTEIRFSETIITNSYSNIIIVMSLISWSEEEFKEIIGSLNISLSSVRFSNNEYDAMGRFLNYNYFIYENIYKSTTLVLDMYLDRLIQYDSYNLRLLGDITGIFDNYLNYMNRCNLKYSNSEMIKKLIFQLKTHDGKLQRRVCSNVLSRFYSISDNNGVKVIRNYIKSIRKEKWLNDEYEEIINEIVLNTHNFDINDNFIKFLLGWIENYLSADIVNSSEFKRNISFKGLKNQIEYLYKEMKFKEYKIINDKIQKKYELLVHNK